MHKTMKNSKKKFLSIRVKMIKRQYKASALENTTLVILEDFSEERAIVKIGLKLGIINTKGEWVSDKAGMHDSMVVVFDGRNNLETYI